MPDGGKEPTRRFEYLGNGRLDCAFNKERFDGGDEARLTGLTRMGKIACLAVQPFDLPRVCIFKL